MKFTLTINGAQHQVNLEEDTPLLWVLRDSLGMTGTKFGCGVGACGACTVHLDGQPVRSCQIPLSAVGNASIQTIEAVHELSAGQQIQDAWIQEQVPQCGYCQSGQIMSASALLRENPTPSDSEIDNAMRGNICRCGSYSEIRKAIHLAASKGDVNHG
ncbi:(2Fe-2S)-binding protein [Motiliproteus sp. MSK22-1]|uniref:(2Fe-2S)-binding protein n=1 Tax=Motiliproteus sp. MSK22-1 TaxID=1897630 RepID=UPI0009756EE3|nr:(2Fe-2S)-binding protein [Motiliproteus sp. MSK22-1]OMH26621.1 isoquinoline 1-oxidoreductase [Motiliproteus sp. MSK22-1]